MVKWKYRSCPRCDGDIFIDGDLYGLPCMSQTTMKENSKVLPIV